jgi:hypothetical protein
MVIMQKIGQSAVLLSKSVMVGYERHSTTAEMLVLNEGLTNLIELKVQSEPVSKEQEKYCIICSNSVKLFDQALQC